MPLSVGDKLGPYEILAPIGAGGMGEVYKARDTKLDREVAIKVLPAALAQDPERLTRFEREAKVLASLNHPNIAQIYGIEESNGVRALVMELVPGQTLKGPLPLETALNYAKQIAEALETAHEKSITHRDLKPVNIMITPAGVIKVLDFGLAAVGQASTPGDGNPTNSPTLTMRATQAGMIMGTAGYMSPEQAAGQTVDRRADIWAFGVVLWEMLTGQRLFTGDTIAHILADVLRAPIDFEELPKETPPSIRDLVRRCLDRDVKNRLQWIGEARFQIQKYLVNPTSATGAMAATPSRSRLGKPWPIFTTALILALGALAFLHFREAPPPQRSMRFQIAPPEKASLESFRLSPDGRYLAIAAGGRLWVRPLDSLEAKALPGTEGAAFPFWSPDSASIGFFSQGKLKKISVDGGPPQSLADAPSARGGAWNRDGVIVLSPGGAGALSRVSAAGGVSTPATKTSGSHRFPEFLPDGRHFLYIAREGPETSGISIGSLDGAPPVRLLPDESNAMYVPPATSGRTGHIVFLRRSTLMAQPFDPDKLRLTSEAFPVAERVGDVLGTGLGLFSTSENGALVYGSSEGANRELVWVDRAGKQIDLAFLGGGQPDFRLAPDEKRVVFSRADSGTTDIWSRDIQRGVTSRLSFDPAQDNMPIWSPDGLRVLWSSNRNGGVFNLFIKSATGTGQDELLVKMGTPTGWATDWSRDGRFILYTMPGAKTGQDLWIAPQFGDRKPLPYLQGQYDEQNGVFSPDGHWISYVSNESGKDEVYVQSFPLSGGKWQISTGGGSEPKWRNDGTELFYVAPDRALMVAPIRTAGASFEPGVPKRLFPVPFVTWVVSRDQFAVSNDGNRFLISRSAGETAATPITVVLNWTAGLKK